jgi:arylsulfatase A
MKQSMKMGIKPTLGVLLFFAVAVAAYSAERPNIVVILADDLGARDLGCYGSAFYETPNLDRIARERA